MKQFFIFLTAMLLLVSCKKDKVDASSTMAFQESINDMASGLSTLEQIKFNEALYILKTFGVEGETDLERMKNLAHLLDAKNVNEILALADSIAIKNEIEWSSTAPPSLGETSIFNNDKASEYDPNDIKAAALELAVTEIKRDSVSGATGVKAVPRLVDNDGQPVEFSNAALEVTFEVYSGGEKLFSTKNLMQNNDFAGFNFNFIKLSADKVVDDKVDITVTVKTTHKKFKKSKRGIKVNPKSLNIPVPAVEEEPEETAPSTTDETPAETPGGDPKVTVSKFLSNLNAQNFRGAYSSSENPNWGSYDDFSNPVSGFGGVKSLSVKKLSPAKVEGSSASVSATYEVTDKEGNSTTLNVTFSLKNTNGEWKISNYKIN